MPLREIFLGMLGLFSRGRDCIKADESKEDDGTRCENTTCSKWCEGDPVSRFDIEDADSNKE